MLHFFEAEQGYFWETHPKGKPACRGRISTIV